MDVSGFDMSQFSLSGFDTGALAWYAGICAVLAALSPSLGSPFMRIIVGGVVGIAAASALPGVRASMGF